MILSLRQSASNRVARIWTVLFSTWGRRARRLSWTASLPSRNALIHRATVWYGNSASLHASRGPWKHSCLLRPRATSILIQEGCYSFINMVLGCSHYLYESQRSTHCSDWQNTVAAGSTDSSNSPCSCLQNWQLSNPPSPLLPILSFELFVHVAKSVSRHHCMYVCMYVCMYACIFEVLGRANILGHWRQ